MVWHIYKIRVMGEPVPWTVYTRRGKPPAAFERMQAWQEAIRGAIIEEYGRPMLDCAVSVDVVFARLLPGEAPKTKAAYLRRAQAAIKRKPDVGNYLKAAEDALQDVLLCNDSQIVETHGRKIIVPFEEQARGPWSVLTVKVLE